MTWTGKIVNLGGFRLTTGVIMVVVLYVVVGFVLKQTTWGRHVYAVGNDAEAARLVGISVNRVLLSVYTLAGLIYGITAWILIGRAGAASPNAAADANLESITAVVIGGTSLFGGRGAVLGTLLGALIVGFFRTGLSLAGVDDQWRVLDDRRARHRRGLRRPVDQEGTRMSTTASHESRANHAGRPSRCSPPAVWSRPSAGWSASTGSTSTSTPVRCSPSSATTAPASPR